jgi:hypothetical protein
MQSGEWLDFIGDMGWKESGHPLSGKFGSDLYK